MKKTTKPCNSSHTITTARRTDNIPLICTSVGPIHPVHSQPMSLATEALPETRLHFCHFPAVFRWERVLWSTNWCAHVNSLFWTINKCWCHRQFFWFDIFERVWLCRFEKSFADLRGKIPQHLVRQKGLSVHTQKQAAYSTSWAWTIVGYQYY